MRSYQKTVFWTVCPTIGLAHLAYKFSKGFVLCCFEGFFDGRLSITFWIFYYFLGSTLLQLCIVDLDLLNQFQPAFDRKLVQVFFITITFLNSIFVLRLFDSLRQILAKSQKRRQWISVIRRVERAESDVLTSYISGEFCFKNLILSTCPALKLVFYYTVIVKVLFWIFLILICVIFVSSHRVIIVNEVVCWHFDRQAINRAERLWLETWQSRTFEVPFLFTRNSWFWDYLCMMIKVWLYCLLCELELINLMWNNGLDLLQIIKRSPSFRLQDSILRLIVVFLHLKREICGNERIPTEVKRYLFLNSVYNTFNVNPCY